jgi:hypothetical protein
MLSDREMYNRMVRGWRGGLAEGTVCGQGSRRANTRAISVWLPHFCRKYKVESVCDAGAGDLHWVKRLQWDVKYQAFDLIPRHPDVKRLDITTEVLPACDAILCRMVLNHLDDERVEMALELFRQSATYLLATHFVGGGEQRDAAFTRLDLTRWLGEPFTWCQDGHEKNCTLAAWSL